MTQLQRSPKGIARWPKLIVPDRNLKTEGVYSVDLVLEDPDEADAFAAELRSKYEKTWFPEFTKRTKMNPLAIKKFDHKMPWTENTRMEGEGEKRVPVEIPGLVFKFKCGASGVSKKTGKAWTNRPVLYDSVGNLLHPLGNMGRPDPREAPDLGIGGGSIIRVGFEPNVYAGFGGGLSLRLVAVQIIELRSGGRTPGFDEIGFEAEEGGFSQSFQSLPAGGEDSEETPF